MPTGLREGLGGEQANASGLGALTQNPFFSGNLQVTGSATVGGGGVFTGGVNVTGSVVTSAGIVGTGGLTSAGSIVDSSIGYVANVGSPYGMGLVVPMTARTVISGGMFVSASGGLAYAAPASSKWFVGIAVPGQTAASGGTVNVIINGIAPVIIEGTVAVGASVQMGAGAGLNCVQPADATKVVSGLRLAGMLDSATSGTTVTGFIQF